MVNVWRLMAHHDKCYQLRMIQWAKANNRIAIGWDVGSLAQYETPGDIQKEVRKQFLGQGPPGEAPTAGIQLWNIRGGKHSFYAGVGAGRHRYDLAMQCEDLVILKPSDWPQSVVMRVTGAYEYVPSPCSGNFQWLYPLSAQSSTYGRLRPTDAMGCSWWSGAGPKQV